MSARVKLVGISGAFLFLLAACATELQETRGRLSPLVPLHGYEAAVERFVTPLRAWAKRSVASRPSVVVALDVDGTCARLSADPKKVRIEEGLIREVRRLEKLGVRVVFITGRAGSEIGEGPGRVYGELLAFERYTDHGATYRRAGKGAQAEPTNERVRRAQQTLRRTGAALQEKISSELAATRGPAEAARLLSSSMERKDYGFALHWRGLPSRTTRVLDGAARRAWMKLSAAQRRGLAFEVFGNVTAQTPHRDGVELRIAGVTKRDAIRDLVRRHRLHRQSSRLLFAGDSGTDEDAFEGLRELFAMGSALSVRVGANTEAKTAALARVASPAEVLLLLVNLRRIIKGEQEIRYGFR